MSTKRMTRATGAGEAVPAVAAFARRFDEKLEALFSLEAAGRSRLTDAMRYPVLAGGKRLRPFLAVQWCRLCGGQESDAMPAALALECVHTFSLVHDDLPALDDDDLRRGRPTCHKVYGDATAILSGDALLTLAFELLAGAEVEARVSQAWVRELADGVGRAGMIAGEAYDLAIEGQTHPIETVQRIHALKTARLFTAACRMGAIAAGADDDRHAAASTYGHQLGLAFQIADDLLDVTGSAAAVGKPVSKDAAAGKLTYPAVVGIEASRAAAAEAAAAAEGALEIFGPAADELRQLARFAIERDC